MNNDRIRQIAVVIAVIAMITVNILANALPINGQATGEISDRFDVYFVPAGYVFSIWGLIYLGLLGYAIYQALPAQAQNPDLQSIGYLFVLSSIANIAWIFFWHYNLFTLSVVAMLALLILLILIYLRLDIGRAQVAPAMKWLVHLPFSIYLGWITVATIANITSWLYSSAGLIKSRRSTGAILLWLDGQTLRQFDQARLFSYTNSTLCTMTISCLTDDENGRLRSDFKEEKNCPP